MDIIAEEERLSQHALLADLQDSEEGDLILDDSQNEDIFSQSCLTLTQRHNLVGKLLDGTENSESSQKRQRIQDFVKEGEYFGRQRASQIENQALRGESTASQIKNNRSQQRLEHQTAASQQGRFRNEPREQLLSSPQTNQRKNVSAGGKSSQIPVQRNSELKGDLSHQRLEHHSKSPTPLPASSMTAASNSQKRSTILTKVNNEGLKSNQGKNKNSESLKTSMRSEYSASSDDDDIVLKDNAAGKLYQ